MMVLLRFIPILSLVTVASFPAVLHVCWSTFAVYQLVLMGFMNVPWIKAHYAHSNISNFMPQGDKQQVPSYEDMLRQLMKQK